MFRDYVVITSPTQANLKVNFVLKEGSPVLEGLLCILQETLHGKKTEKDPQNLLCGLE